MAAAPPTAARGVGAPIAAFVGCAFVMVLLAGVAGWFVLARTGPSRGPDAVEAAEAPKGVEASDRRTPDVAARPGSATATARPDRLPPFRGGTGKVGEAAALKWGAVDADQGPRFPHAAAEWGTWRFALWPDVGRVTLYNVERPNGVVISIWEESNGWAYLQTERGKFALYSTASSDDAEFSWKPLAPETRTVTLSDGKIRHGHFTIEITGEDLYVRHARSDWRLRLWKTSNGWIDVELPDGTGRTVYSADDAL